MFFLSLAVHADETVAVTILFTAGSKGYFLPCKVPNSQVLEDLTLKIGDRYGGYAALGRYIRSERAAAEAEGRVVLVLDGGNSLVGSSEADFFRGAISVDFMNRVGYDAMTVSNLDFSLGKDCVDELSRKARFPFLNANLVDKMTERPPEYLKSGVMIERGGTLFGIVGYAQSDMDRGWLDPKSIEGLSARPAIPFVQTEVDALRERGAEMVIAIDHTAGSSHLDVARGVRGIDILLDGAVEWAYVYTTSFTPEKLTYVGSTAVVPEADAHFALGRVDFVLRKKVAVISDLRYRRVFLDLDQVEEDSEIKDFVAKYSRVYFDILGDRIEEVIGAASADITTDWRDNWESPLGTVVCDALREATGADIGIQNLGGIRRFIRKGPIKVRDVEDAVPFGNKIITFEIAGRDLERLPLLWLVAAARPPVPWTYISGATVSRDSYLHVKNVTVNDEPIEPDRIYTVATNSYLLHSGYLHSAFCRNVRESEQKVAEAVVKYIRRHSPISPTRSESGSEYEY